MAGSHVAEDDEEGDIRLQALVTVLPGRLRRRLRRALRGRSGHRQRDAPAPTPEPQMREFVLELPRAGHKGAGVRSLASLRLRAEPHLYVPKRLEESGLAGYEPETMSCFIAALHVLPRGAVFDVGANVGVFALVAAALTDWNVIAFEPTPDLAATARALAELNGLRYGVEELALGAQPGEASFFLSSVTDSSNSLRSGFRPSSRTITVLVSTLDDYCQETSVRPSLLKIDTESTEPDVLRGATHLLTEERPWIICEVLAGRSEAELMRVLEPFGYQWYQITEEQPFRLRHEIVGDPTYRFMNWLFVPEPPGDRFWSARERWLERLRQAAPPAP